MMQPYAYSSENLKSTIATSPCVLPSTPLITAPFVDGHIYPIRIAVEGLSASGKSTLAAPLAEYLTAAGIKVITTHSPDYSLDNGDKLRAILQKAEGRCDPATVAEFMQNQLLNDKNCIAQCVDSMQKHPETLLAIVFDRSLYCGIAYSCQQVPQLVAEILSFYSALPPAEFCVLLVTDEETRKARLANRTNPGALMTPQIYQDKLKEICMFPKKSLVINTGLQTVEKTKNDLETFLTTEVIPVIKNRATL